MTTADALVAQIAENPNDITTRLIYADCVEEEGDAEYAEFIRTQIEYAKLQDVRESGALLDGSELEHHAKVITRIKEFDDYVPPCDRGFRDGQLIYKNGFAYTLYDIAVNDFCDRAKELFRTRPITFVALNDRAPTAIATRADSATSGTRGWRRRTRGLTRSCSSCRPHYTISSYS